MSTFQNITPLDVADVHRSDRVLVIADISAFASHENAPWKIVKGNTAHMDESVAFTTVVVGIDGTVIDVLTDIIPEHVLDGGGGVPDVALYEAINRIQGHQAADILVAHLQSECKTYGVDFDHYAGDRRAPEYQNNLPLGIRRLCTAVMVAKMSDEVGRIYS